MPSEAEVVQHVFKKHYSKLASGILSVPRLACELYSAGLIAGGTKNNATKGTSLTIVCELLNDVEGRIKTDTSIFYRFLGVLQCENVDLGYLADPMEYECQQMLKKPPDVCKEEEQTPYEESAGPDSTRTEASGGHRDLDCLSDLKHQQKPDTISEVGVPLPFPHQKGPIPESVEKMGTSEQVFPDLDSAGTLKQVEGPIPLLCSQFPKTKQRLGGLIAAVEKYNAENPESCDLVLEEKRELVEDYEVEYRTLKEEKEQDCKLHKLEISQLKDQHKRENQTQMDTIAMQRCHIYNLEDSLKEYKLLDDKYQAKEQELMICKEREKELSDLTHEVLKQREKELADELKLALNKIERELCKLNLDRKQRKEEIEDLKNAELFKEIVDSEDTDISGIVEKTRRLRRTISM